MNTRTWRKSPHSGDYRLCVELATDPDGTTHIRDSKDPNGPHLTFTRAEMDAFRAGIIDGSI